MAQIGRQNTKGGFVTEMFLILAIILATKVSQVKTELPTKENCPDVVSVVNDNDTCVFTEHCSKAVCTTPPDLNTGQIRHMTVQALVCNQLVKANVTLGSSSVKWSHTFKDGEKVALPDSLKPSDAPSGLKQSLKVELVKHDPYSPYVYFKLVLVFDYAFMNYNVTFLEGNLKAAECESHVTVFPTPMISGGDGADCPDIQLPDNSGGTCVLDYQCSKVTCMSPPDSTGPFSHMDLTVQAYGCPHQPVEAKVSLDSSSARWSHTFKDGEKVALPNAMKPPEAPADLKVFLEAELTKNGSKVHFKLLLLFESEYAPYNVTFLEGDLHPWTKCTDEGENSKQCPAVNFMPAITEDEKAAFSTFKCVYSNQCSKVTCIEATKDHKLTVGFEVNKCGQSLSGKVTLKQPDVLDWSHSLGDGEKAKLPAVPGSFSGDLKVSDASLFIKVGLQEMKGNKVNFTVSIVGQITIGGETGPVNVMLLEGELAISTDDCADEGENSKQCPAVNFMPAITQDDKAAFSTFKCAYSNHCSKVTCVTANADHKLTVGLEVNKCGQSLSGKVTLKQPDEFDWSHSLGDGEKAKLPTVPSSFTGDLKVSDASLFVKVGLQEMKGNKVNFTVSIVGQITILGEPGPVNVMLLEGELAIPTDACHGGPWFSRQSSGVKAAVIIIPILVVTLLVFVLALFCYKKRQSGKRFLVDIFYGREKDGMQRLSDEL